LIVSSLSVLGGMVLAIHWAAGPHLGWRVMSVGDMARTHGLLNGLGFVAVGLFGRWRERRRCVH
jgi:hypothetical protein